MTHQLHDLDQALLLYHQRIPFDDCRMPWTFLSHSRVSYCPVYDFTIAFCSLIMPLGRVVS